MPSDTGCTARSSPWPPQPSMQGAQRPDGQIPLTRNEIACLLVALIIQPVRDTWHRLRWPPCGDATSTTPEHATITGKPANHEDHELRLEY